MENQESKNNQQIVESIKIEDLPRLEDITPQEQKGIFGGTDYENGDT